MKHMFSHYFLSLCSTGVSGSMAWHQGTFAPQMAIDAFGALDGVSVALATQESFGQDIERIRLLIQNAAPSRHGVRSYFNRRPQSESFRFFALPGRGTIADDFVVDRFRAAFGDLFFEAPTGAWEEGTYMLVLEHEGVRAAVPIELE